QYPWKEGLRVTLKPDVEACRKAYGKNWTDACAARFGDDGAPVVGIRMQPAASGQWRWEGASMVFTPDTPLSPGTRYTLDLSASPRPAGVSVAPAVLRFTTFPLAVSFGNQQLWIDPSPRAAHGVSCTLTFTYPVDPAIWARNISLRPADPASGLQLGKQTLVWNQARDEVTVSAPVVALPSATSFVEVRVAGMPAYMMKGGRPRLVADDR
ncbi:MAG: hypothetical protein K2O70_06825, partial [Desulfovibrionaceae bacterium]|nr:hypothetical protein [Desulfovibrionaceae bacterium]